MLPLADVDYQRRAIDLRRLPNQVGERRDQFQRHVVDRIEAQILKCLERGSLAGSGEAGQDHQFRSHRRRRCLLAGLLGALGFAFLPCGPGARLRGMGPS